MATELPENMKSKHGEEAPIVGMLGMTVQSATEHKAIIDKWGRYPHR